MRVLQIDEARARFAELCADALGGEVIHLQFPGGALLQLSAVVAGAKAPPFSEQELLKSYDDPEWAAFENNCGKASD